MCAIIGALLYLRDEEDTAIANGILSEIFIRSSKRGRDGVGYDAFGTHAHHPIATARYLSLELFTADNLQNILPATHGATILVANLRAEPTTEYVKEKKVDDQQPYRSGNWTIVHNGTIANDHELRDWAGARWDRCPTTIDSAAIAEVLASPLMAMETADTAFENSIRELKGSYAILARCASEPNTLYLAANYRPIWFVTTPIGVFFGSARDVFPDNVGIPQMVTPYTMERWTMLGNDLSRATSSLRAPRKVGNVLYSTNIPYAGKRALVVCSGGLDSVVAASYMQHMGADVSLINFQYGSRAQGPEITAVQGVAQRLGVPLKLFPLPVYDPSDSPLLRADSDIAGGEAGAEFAHEWVPARNLIMLSVATAYAEANGFELIVLGNNLEEAGAYPDNEPEFIDRFNDLLPFAVGDGKKVSVVMPVGNMMKHEIVALGARINAPLDLTWSCYRAGEKHCGTCGPCFMRKTAFNINNLSEVIPYENDNV